MIGDLGSFAPIEVQQCIGTWFNFFRIPTDGERSFKDAFETTLDKLLKSRPSERNAARLRLKAALQSYAPAADVMNGAFVILSLYTVLTRKPPPPDVHESRMDIADYMLATWRGLCAGKEKRSEQQGLLFQFVKDVITETDIDPFFFRQGSVTTPLQNSVMFVTSMAFAMLRIISTTHLSTAPDLVRSYKHRLMTFLQELFQSQAIQAHMLPLGAPNRALRAWYFGDKSMEGTQTLVVLYQLDRSAGPFVVDATAYADASHKESVMCRATTNGVSDEKIIKICKLGDGENETTLEAFKKEYEYTIRASEIGVGPIVYQVGIDEDKQYGYIEMQRYDFNLEELIQAYKKAFRDMEDKECSGQRCAAVPPPRAGSTDVGATAMKLALNPTEASRKLPEMFRSIRRNFFKLARDGKMYHLDLHQENIMFNQNVGITRPYFIDFGRVADITDLNQQDLTHSSISVDFDGEEVIVSSVYQAFKESIYATESVLNDIPETILTKTGEFSLQEECRKALFGEYEAVEKAPLSAERLLECLERSEFNSFKFMGLAGLLFNALDEEEEMGDASKAYLKAIIMGSRERAKQVLLKAKRSGETNMIMKYIAAGPYAFRFFRFQNTTRDNVVLAFFKSLDQEERKLINQLSKTCFYQEDTRAHNKTPRGKKIQPVPKK